MKSLSLVLTLVECIAAVLLVVLALLGIAQFGIDFIRGLRGGVLDKAMLATLLDGLLLLFVVVELLRLTLTYLQGRNIVPTVLETMLVAGARKLVSVEAGHDALLHGALAAGSLVAIGILWLLLAKAHALESERSGTAP